MGGCYSARPKSPAESIQKGWVDVAVTSGAILHDISDDTQSEHMEDVDLSDDSEIVIRCHRDFGSESKVSVNFSTGTEDPKPTVVDCKGMTFSEVSTIINDLKANHQGKFIVSFEEGPGRTVYSSVRSPDRKVILIWALSVVGIPDETKIMVDVPVLLRVDTDNKCVDVCTCNSIYPKWVRGKRLSVFTPDTRDQVEKIDLARQLVRDHGFATSTLDFLPERGGDLILLRRYADCLLLTGKGKDVSTGERKEGQQVLHQHHQPL